ncbi:hypothetical protein D3C72_1484340 [compost metagenome]
MLGPVVEVLGQAVRGAHVRELRCLAKGFPDGREDAGCRVADGLVVLRVHRVVAQRIVERLVVRRERPFIHALARKEARHPFGVHDEWAGTRFRLDRHAVVGHIRAAPGLAVPLDQHAVGVERLAFQVGRRTVVQHPAVSRPGPGPVQRVADAGGVAVVAAAHLVARFRPAAGVDPAAAHGGAVVTQLAKA